LIIDPLYMSWLSIQCHHARGHWSTNGTKIILNSRQQWEHSKWMVKTQWRVLSNSGRLMLESFSLTCSLMLKKHNFGSIYWVKLKFFFEILKAIFFIGLRFHNHLSSKRPSNKAYKSLLGIYNIFFFDLVFFFPIWFIALLLLSIPKLI